MAGEVEVVDIYEGFDGVIPAASDVSFASAFMANPVAGFSWLGQSLAAGLSGLASVGFVLGTLSFVVGVFRVAPDLAFKIGGLPVMKQLSWGGMLKNLFKSITSGIKAVFNLCTRLLTKIEQILGLVKKNTNGNIVSASQATNTIRNNPNTATLDASRSLLAAFGTATSTTTAYLNNISTSTDLGLAWWETKKQFVSTSTGSYQSIFYSVQYFSNCVTGVVKGSPFMTIEGIIQAGNAYDDNAKAIGLMKPTLADFAGCIYDKTLLTNATRKLARVIVDAKTKDITTATFKADIVALNSATQVLLNRLNLDVSNQATYIAQTSHLDQMALIAADLSFINKTATPTEAAFYRDSINPALVDTISDMSLLQDLNSPDPKIAQDALNAINAADAASGQGPFPTTSVVDKSGVQINSPVATYQPGPKQT